MTEEQVNKFISEGNYEKYQNEIAIYFKGSYIDFKIFCDKYNHDFEELAKPPEIIKEVIKEYFKDDVK